MMNNDQGEQFDLRFKIPAQTMNTLETLAKAFHVSIPAIASQFLTANLDMTNGQRAANAVYRKQKDREATNEAQRKERKRTKRKQPTPGQSPG